MNRNKSWLFLLSMILAVTVGAGMLAAAGNVAQGGKGSLNKPVITDAQTLDVNQIECFIQNDGHFAENPATGGDGFFYPKGQRNNSIIFTSGLWVLGKINKDVRTAACSYSSEFQPGAILPGPTADDPTLPKYKIYKYDKGETVEADAIAQGCPSEVMGDQMLFCVFNDLGSHADVWQKPPIGIEVQQTAFAFNQTGALGNTVFLKYRFINKSQDTLKETYSAIFFDPDLGFANDDFVGCDTTLGIGFVFNGDGYDDGKYGVQVPAMACDFFQGPIVQAPGETAVLPDGTTYPDMKILDMTAFFAYINGSPIAGMEDPSLQDANGALEAYFFASGYRGNGDPWQDPTQGNAETNFPFAGDPVSGTGWLMADISAPKDMRFGLSAGPFTLAPNDPKDVVVGIVVGQGSDNLSSLSVMKYYDAIAQNAYNKNFVLPSPPPLPTVKVAHADEDLMLIWNSDAAAYSAAGYEFEGYNVWQSASASGPWKRIETFDKVNGITTIWDMGFNESVGTLLEMPIQFGADKGVRYNFHVEKDYLNNVPLVNGKEYYFAVTGYAFNPDEAPKILENNQVGVTAIPQNPVADVEYHAVMMDSIATTKTGVSDGDVIVEVMDPAKVTGHEYEVTFYEGEEGEPLWKLTDKTTGAVVLKDQANQSTTATNDQFEVVDGIKVKVYGAIPGFKAVVESANPAGDPCGPTAKSTGGCPDPGNHIWHGLNSTSEYIASAGGAPGDFSRLERFADYASPRDFEMRFTEAGGFAVNAFTDDMICTVPFEIWAIGVSTPNDPSDDVRMIPFISPNDSSKATWGWANGVDGYFGWPCSDWVYFMDPEDPDGYSKFHATCLEAGGAGATYPYATDGSRDGYWADFYGGFVYPIGRFVLIDYAETGTPPPAGTTIRLITNKPNDPATSFAFNTADYTKKKSEEVAKARIETINVFPNPYFAQNEAESDYFTQFVTFNNLPEKCTIRVFSLSGQLVRTLQHENGTPFEKWYLLNEQQLPVASGMYLVHVETAFGNKILKLAVINRESRYQHL